MMTRIPENRIKAFIELIESQASIFSAENRVDLDQQLDKFPEDVESLSNAITAWCLQYLHIDLALNQKLDASDDSMPGILRSITETIREPQKEDFKKLIKNQMRKSFPETTTETKPSDSNQ
ncbi:MAG: hypothetical protein F6K21_36035 [Symploca sp. SIO2D2]|nr:hypothetical protein [Symploca sp. SIO2D2]